MTTKQPTLGDRVLLSNPNCEADRVGTVIAKRETRFGIDFELQLDETNAITYINQYVGTAEDRGRHYETRNYGGIGAYLITANAPDGEHECVSVSTRDGAYCKVCGETLA